MARRPFSLSAYLAFARESGSGAAWTPSRERPGGPLLWLHASTPSEARALTGVAQRLAQNRPELNVLRTGAWDEDAEPLPAETVQDAERFLAHWQPTIAIWSGTALRPCLLWTAHAAAVPLLHVDPGDTTHHAPAPGWIPDVVPTTLGLFDTIFTPNAESERRLARAHLSSTRIRRSGALGETAMPLDCNEDLHEEMLGLLAGRPTWLAARLRSTEAHQVIEAHRRATRLSHRLLLILVPASSADAEYAADAAEASDLRICRWEDGEMPDDSTQVVLCSGAEEIGLWYRLAPLSFLGGSLMSGHGGTDPYEAAALGTAILYGPNVGRHLSSYSTLVDAGAARIVRDAESLAGAVSQLLAPDRAAAMSHAAWDVVSAGAAATDAVIDRVSELLDDKAPEAA